MCLFFSSKLSHPYLIRKAFLYVQKGFWVYEKNFLRSKVSLTFMRKYQQPDKLQMSDGAYLLKEKGGVYQCYR